MVTFNAIDRQISPLVSYYGGHFLVIQIYVSLWISSTVKNLQLSYDIPAEPVSLVPPEAFFTEPETIEEGRTSTVILDKLVKLIDAVPEGESIYISIYQFEYGPLLEALERAHSRNVKLYVTLDMSNRSDNTGTANRLTVLGENVEIVRIRNDASASAINHNKFVLFPEINTEEGTADPILFQTSQNFKEAAARKIQDGVILSNENLYEAYLDYWEGMKALAAEEMSNFEYREYSDPAKDVTAYFHPKRKDGVTYGSDTVVEILDDIAEQRNLALDHPEIVEKLKEAVKEHEKEIEENSRPLGIIDD